MSVVITVTVRPVQSFIAQSRKFIDLVNGSKMLSDITSMILEDLEKRYQGVKRIYPIKSGSKDESTPNLFTIIVNTDETVEIKPSLDLVTKDLIDRWEKYSKTKDLAPNIENWGRSQLEEFLVVDYVVYPLGNKKDREAHDDIKALLGTAKRDYPVRVLSETGQKCKNCGERNILVGFGRGFFGKPKPHNLKKFNINEGTEGEGLCAVCIVKRSWSKVAINSVSDIALGSNPDLLKYEKRLREILADRYDSDILLNKQIPQELELTKKERGKIVEILKETKDLKPTKYYSMLLFDGDNLGTIMDTGSDENLFAEQVEKSKRLSQFTGDLRKLFNADSRNHLIYAGGDDVFAALELRSTFTLTDEIRKKYPSDLGDGSSTASAGIVVAHHKTPLSYVVEGVRSSEKAAKKNEGKDSVAITVMPHSGDSHTGVFRWTYGSQRTLILIEEIVNAININELTSTFTYQLIQEFSFLSKWSDDIIQEKGLLKLELKRLLLRSKPKEGRKKMVEEVYSKLSEVIENSASPKEIFDLLRIVDFISRRTTK